jgi:transposase
MGLSRRRFTREFKEAAVRRMEMGVPVVEVARTAEVSPNALYRWRRELREFGSRAFAGPGRSRAEEQQVAALERKVGQQALEIDFLRGCLQHVEEQRKRRTEWPERRAECDKQKRLARSDHETRAATAARDREAWRENSRPAFAGMGLQPPACQACRFTTTASAKQKALGGKWNCGRAAIHGAKSERVEEPRFSGHGYPPHQQGFSPRLV